MTSGLSMPRLYKAIALALIVACTWSASGPAQEYPSQPVRLIVPYPAGGTADAVARILGDHLSRKWREAVVVENRSGAGGNLGAEFVAASPADGHTLPGHAPSAVGHQSISLRGPALRSVRLGAHCRAGPGADGLAGPPQAAVR